MLIVLPISKNDFQKSLNVLGFVKALNHFGPYPNHQLLVVCRPKDIKEGKAIFDFVKPLFPDGSEFYFFEADGPGGWPRGPNFYWRETIEYLKKKDNKLPWFWMELDVIPLKPKWIDLLEEEYYKQGKPCLGTVQNTTSVTEDQLLINIAQHLQGTAVYPPRLDEICSIWEYVDRLPTAFDVICQWEIIPNTADTKLVQQGFRTNEYKVYHEPFMIKGEDMGHMNGVVQYDQPLHPEAVVHHGCKDSSLADIVTSQEYDFWLKELCNAKA